MAVRFAGGFRPLPQSKALIAYVVEKTGASEIRRQECTRLLAPDIDAHVSERLNQLSGLCPVAFVAWGADMGIDVLAIALEFAAKSPDRVIREAVRQFRP